MYGVGLMIGGLALFRVCLPPLLGISPLPPRRVGIWELECLALRKISSPKPEIPVNAQHLDGFGLLGIGFRGQERGSLASVKNPEQDLQTSLKSLVPCFQP